MTKTTSKSGVTFKTIQYVYMLICVIIALFPLVWVFLSSFKTNNEILSGGFTMPKSFGFDGYVKALQLSPILRFFVNSAIISVISAIVNDTEVPVGIHAGLMSVVLAKAAKKSLDEHRPVAVSEILNG